MDLSEEEKKRLKEARIATGAGTQAAQQMGYVDPNTANTVLNVAGKPAQFGALMVQWTTALLTGVFALFTGIFAFFLKGFIIVKGIILLPFIWPFLLIGAIFFCFKKLFED